MNKILLILILTSSIGYAQRGIVSGVLKESNDPVPGAQIIIKGTSIGTQTDFDGNYSIECNVGDVLVITFVGFSTQEITVTEAMFKGAIIPYKTPRMVVQQIKTKAYADALLQKIDSLGVIPDINASPYVYVTEKDRSPFRDIKDIKIKDSIVYLDYLNSDYYIRSEYSNNLKSRSINKRNLPNRVANPFETAIQLSQNASTSIYNNDIKSRVSLSHNTGKDNYNNRTYNTYALSGEFEKLSHKKIPFLATVNYSKTTNRFANINGYQNLIFAEQLLNLTEENNPFNSINKSKSERSNKTFGTHLKASKNIGDNFELIVDHALVISKNEEEYSLQDGVFNYENGYSSYKSIDHLTSNNTIIFESNLYSNYTFDLNTTTTFLSKYKNINYNFNEEIDLVSTQRDVNLDQHIFEIRNKVELSYNSFLYLTTGISQLYSSNQKGDSFIPQGSITFIPTSAFYDLQGQFLNYLNIAIRYGKSAGTTDLIYTNYSHNSLLLDITNATSLLNNTDLFFPNNLDLEKNTSFEVALETRLFNNRLSIGGSYEKRENTNGIFPTLTGNNFTLSNLANTETSGFDIDIKLTNLRYNSSNIHWNTNITLSRKRTIVTDLLSPNTRISIAGFASTNANLIEGETAGVIVGSAYERNDQGTIITDTNGNPIQATEPQIIGDPTPDFNLGLHNELYKGRWKLNLTIDYQKDGDIWNGTQKALDGFIGIDEFYIENGSYLNLKNITASFELIDNKKWVKSQHKPFFNSFKISGFANNLITATAYKGATPYSSIFDSTSAQGLQYFNTPLATEIGINVVAKF